jgi:hypothetical protein
VAKVPSYDTLKNKQRELIRKALDGSVFVAPFADPTGDPTAVFTNLTAKTGTAPNEVIDLVALPTGWDDLGLLSTDGVSFASDVTTSDVQSWGSVTPTRTDIVSDTTTLTVTAQETKALTIGILSGVDVASLTPNVDTGEVAFAKPTRPAGSYYRLFSLAVDLADAGEIYIGRFLPRAKKSNQGEQAFGGGDDPISYPFTFTGEVDDTLGFSEKWYFGGAGWNAMLAEMGWS